MDTLELPVVRPDAPPDAPHPAVGRTSGPPALRIFAGLLGALGASLAVVLMLSDRAPGLVRAMFGDTARALWARVDADRRTAIADAGLAEPDLVVHIGVWATVTGLFALTIWSWRGLVVVAVGAAVASTVIELGQRRWASTRAFELSDVAGNLVGVGLGIVAAAAVMTCWALVTDVRRRLR